MRLGVAWLGGLLVCAGACAGPATDVDGAADGAADADADAGTNADAGTDADLGLLEGALFYPGPSVSWAGVVPVVVGADLPDPALGQIGSFSIDGVLQPMPVRRPDGAPPGAPLDTRLLVDGSHRFEVLLWADPPRVIARDFEVRNRVEAPAFAGALVDVTTASVGAREAGGALGAGAISLDVDGDGATDLFVWEAGRASLLRQTAPLTFTSTPVDLPGNVVCAGAADLDGDGSPEIVAAGEGIWVLSARGGVLVDASADVPEWARTGQRFTGVTFADLDLDGLLDVAIAQMACGRGASVVLRNEGELRFFDAAPYLGLAFEDGATFAFAIDSIDPLLEVWSFEEGCTPTRTSRRLYARGDGPPTFVREVHPPFDRVAPMGSAWIDADGDGALDLWAAGDVVSPLWMGPDFATEEAVTQGLAGWSDGTDFVSAWSMVLFDADMDGRSDIFVVHDPSDPVQGPGAPADALFWRAPIGYRDLAALAGLSGIHACRAAHGADLDRDGDLDLVVGCREGLRILRNDLARTGAARTLALRSHASPPGGVHALVTTPSGETLRVRGGGQPYAGGLAPIAFAATPGDTVRVRWPSGITQDATVGAGPTMVVEEPDVFSFDARRVAGGAEVRVTVRPAAIAMDDELVDVEATAGSWTTPPARQTDGSWEGVWLAPAAPAEPVFTIHVGSLVLATRPRVFVRL